MDSKGNWMWWEWILMQIKGRGWQNSIKPWWWWICMVLHAIVWPALMFLWKSWVFTYEDLGFVYTERKRMQTRKPKIPARFLVTKIPFSSFLRRKLFAYCIRFCPVWVNSYKPQKSHSCDRYRPVCVNKPLQLQGSRLSLQLCLPYVDSLSYISLRGIT